MNLIAMGRYALASAKADMSRGDCSACIHFRSEPAFIEAQVSGLAIMSSGYASVCATDGLCARQERIINGRRRCGDFSMAAPA